MSSNTVLITGGNRGLGKGLVQRFLQQPNHTVIAAVRSPDHITARALGDLPRGCGSILLTVAYDASCEGSADEAVATLEKEHGVDRLDIVVANAGISKQYPLVRDVQRGDVLEHIDVNVFGVIALYQATRHLLQRSAAARKPIFAPMGSLSGSLGLQLPVPNATYGPSKAMLNWYGVRINAEDEWLNALILEPGFVQTDMGNSAARLLGEAKAPVELQNSVEGLFRVLTTATKEKHGGRMVDYMGQIQEW